MNINQETILRAQLGDPEAAKECTDAGVAIPCPICGDNVVWGCEVQYLCDKCDFHVSLEEAEITGLSDDESRETVLSEWNTRPNLIDAARELFEPKWVACSDETIPAIDCLVWITGGIAPFPVVRRRWQVKRKSDNGLHATHWMPLPQPPKEDSNNG